MKIAFITTHLTIYGGGSKFLVDYSNELSKRGHEITIVAQKVNYNHYKFHNNIKIIEIGGSLPSSIIYWFNFNKIKKRYFKLLNKLDCELIISQFFPINYFCSKISKNRKDLKHIHYCHEPFRLFYEKKYYLNAPISIKIPSLFLKIFFKKYDFEGTYYADYILCNSNFTRSRVKEVYNKDSIVFYRGLKINNRINKIYDFNLRKKLNLQKDPPIIFALGLTHHMKGGKELIHIFHKIQREIPESILLIGGKITKQNKKIIKYVKKELKIPHNKIIFYGFIEQQNLRVFYTQSTLTLYTALYEPLGLIPLESMLNGTPVIAFNSGGPSETIIQGKTGFLINSHDYEDFAQKAINIIENKELREELSLKAKEHIKRNFNFEKSISSLETLFQKFISK